MPEKRRFQRASSVLPLQYKKLKESRDSTTGVITRDVGEGGVRFVSNEFLPLASRLVVELFLPAQPKPIKAIAKVAWIKKAPSGEQYEVGNQFLDIGREDKDQLTDYVKKNQTETF